MVPHPDAEPENHCRIVCRNPSARHCLRAADCGKDFQEEHSPESGQQARKAVAELTYHQR